MVDVYITFVLPGRLLHDAEAPSGVSVEFLSPNLENVNGARLAIPHNLEVSESLNGMANWEILRTLNIKLIADATIPLPQL